PSWVPGLGGKGFSLPRLPMLAKGGDITRAGWAIVGEQGPEVLHMPRGAQVQPLRGGRDQVPAAEQRITGTITLRGEGILAGLREVINIKGGRVDQVLTGSAGVW